MLIFSSSLRKIEKQKRLLYSRKRQENSFIERFLMRNFMLCEREEVIKALLRLGVGFSSFVLYKNFIGLSVASLKNV